MRSSHDVWHLYLAANTNVLSQIEEAPFLAHKPLTGLLHESWSSSKVIKALELPVCNTVKTNLWLMEQVQRHHKQLLHFCDVQKSHSLFLPHQYADHWTCSPGMSGYIADRTLCYEKNIPFASRFSVLILQLRETYTEREMKCYATVVKTSICGCFVSLYFFLEMGVFKRKRWRERSQFFELPLHQDPRRSDLLPAFVFVSGFPEHIHAFQSVCVRIWVCLCIRFHLPWRTGCLNWPPVWAVY